MIINSGNNDKNVNYNNNNSNINNSFSFQLFLSVLFNSQKAMSLFMKETEISEKKQQKAHTLPNKTECQKYKILVTTFVKSIPANSLVLISTKFINQNLSKATDEIF